MRHHAVARTLFVVTLLAALCLTSVGSVMAQGGLTPVEVGENRLGEIPDDASSVGYKIEVATPQSINIQLLPITPGFHAILQVLDPSGVRILSNDDDVPSTISLSSAGAYTLVIASTDGTTGQFLLSVQPGAPLAPPTELIFGEMHDGLVDSENARQAYLFAGLADEALLLSIDAADEATGLVIAIRDADTDELLSLSGARLGGLRYRILSGDANYLLEITHSGSSAAEAFRLCVASESAMVTCSGEHAAGLVINVTATPAGVATTANVVIDPTGGCQVASSRGVSINVRAGAGTNFGVVGNLAPNVTAPVIGRLADNTWFQVNVNGVIGWVSASVVTLGGNCAGVSVVIAPPAPVVIVPTSPPLVPTNPSPAGEPPTIPTTAPVVEVPTAVPVLLPGSPRYTQNFPDGLLMGSYILFNSIGRDSSPVDVSYLGSGCSGYAAAEPDYMVTYTGVGASALYIGFENDVGAEGLVILGPNGSYRCVDRLVSARFTGAFSISGTYQIWVTVRRPDWSFSRVRLRLREE